ncbi:hypothetical protein C8R46DRAFT_1268286 [Mycena filopes]|nr:hypothetical protein C8R46DRAFT_1268286 [Mycena filopes]
MPSGTTRSAENVLSALYFHPLSKLTGTFLDCFLVGTLLVQICIYRTCFPNDSLKIKFLAHFVFAGSVICAVFETLHVVGISAGDFTTFANSRYLWFASPLFGALIAMLVQLFYCFRIVTLRRKAWPVAVLIALIAAAECGGALGWVILGWVGRSMGDRDRIELYYIWLVGGALADVLIAVIMTALLLETSSSVPQTQDIVKTLVRLIIGTNALSSVVALLGLFLFVFRPHTLDFMCPMMILPGIYANTLLVMLNERAAMRRASEGGIIDLAGEQFGKEPQPKPEPGNNELV